MINHFQYKTLESKALSYSVFQSYVCHHLMIPNWSVLKTTVFINDWLKRSLWCRLAALQWRNAVLLLLIRLFFAPLKYYLSLMLVKKLIGFMIYFIITIQLYFIHDFIWCFLLKRSLWCRLAALQWRNAVLLLLIRLFFAPLKYFL